MKFRQRERTDFLYIHFKKTGGLTLKELHRDARRSGELAVDYHYIVQENGLVEEGRQRYDIAGRTMENAEASLYVLVAVDEDGAMSDAQRYAYGLLMEDLLGEFVGVEIITTED